ncbi:hypothetical protein JB92DRAFT_2831395 [Gautieria morchelliformis]|nr:hypothetical protein JB92DRAFT_2831395 [Gautieria morchelliformis]
MKVHAVISRQKVSSILQVEADKQRLARQRDRRLTREEAARAQEAREAEIAALRAEGLGDEDIEDFLDDPNANDSEDEPEPHPGRIQENEFTFKATTAVVTAAAKPAMSNAVQRQTASSPAPLRSVTRDTVQPHDRPYASSPPPRPDSGAVDRNHKKTGLGGPDGPSASDDRHATHSDSDSNSKNADPERPQKIRKTYKEKPKAADYEGLANSILTMAMTEFQVRICTKNAFPDMDECEEWAEECWQNVTARGSTIRGQVKDKAVTKVVSHYNFKHGQQPRQTEYNKTLAAQLLEDDGYSYEDVEASTGIYQHQILKDVHRVLGVRSSGVIVGAQAVISWGTQIMNMACLAFSLDTFIDVSPRS